MRPALALFAAMLFTAGCLGSSQIQTVRDRATFDLQCDAEQINVKEISENAYGVEGCGHRVTYICTNVMPSTCAVNTYDGKVH